jgi:hypothetical protein
MNRITKRMKSTNQSWHSGSIGAEEDVAGFALQLGPVQVELLVVFRENVGQGVQIPHEFVLLLLVIGQEETVVSELLLVLENDDPVVEQV